MSRDAMSRMRLKKLASAVAVLAATACTHSVHLVHVSDFDGVPKSGGKLIEAHTEQFVILGFVSQVSYVDKAYHQLMDQCGGGRIQGITTQFSTSHGFFSWTNKLLMRGLCIKGGGKSSRGKGSKSGGRREK